MPDLRRIEGFDWDVGNRGKNLRHGVRDGEAEQVFIGVPLLILEDARHSTKEQRYQALGQSQEGRRLHVTVALRDETRRIRVISARDMNRKERAIYEAKNEGTP